MSLSREAREKAIAAVLAQYPGEIQDGTQEPSVKFITTGSLELDFAMGGGLPIGRWSRFYGPWSCGKSLIAWQVIKHAQKMGMTCAYYNVEKQYDKDFVKKLGVNTKDLVIVQGTVIEEVVTKMETLLGGINLHVIDSASSAIALDELAAKAEDQFIGLSARTWGRGLRRLLNRFDTSENLGLYIDQVRSSIKFSGDDEPPGGKMMEHSSSMTVSFRRGSWLFRSKDGLLYDDIKKTERKAEDSMSRFLEPDGHEIRAYVKKSRVGRPFRNARLYWGSDTNSFDHTHEFFQAARVFAVVEGSGWYTLPDGSKVQGEPGLRRAIAADQKLRKKIHDTVMAHAR